MVGDGWWGLAWMGARGWEAVGGEGMRWMLGWDGGRKKSKVDERNGGTLEGSHEIFPPSPS